MSPRSVVVAVWDLPPGCRDTQARRARAAQELADRASLMGFIQVDPVVIGYVEDAVSVASAVVAAAASAGVTLHRDDLTQYEQVQGWRVHVGVCPVVQPIAVTTVDPEGGTRLRNLLESGQNACTIAARTRMTVERIDTIRASLRLPYRAPVPATRARAPHTVGAR